MRELSLRLGRPAVRSVPAVVGRGALARLVADAAARRPALVVLVSDSNVATLHAGGVLKALRRRGLRSELLSFPAGEASKTRRTKAILEDRLVELGAGHETLLVALGGGVTGDLTGFLASTWQRGVPVLHAPSTLLSMADSALGGKTGVNLPGGKNLVGSFHQPAAVYADTDLLSTLPEPEWAHGFAEVVKTAVVADRRLFAALEAARRQLAARRLHDVEHAIAECLRLKGRIVARDERESGRRMVLNFGHTVAHALESASGYRMPHGRAVAVGLRAEGALATRISGFPRAHQARLSALLDTLTAGPLHVRIVRERFLDAAARDKKNRRGELRCALPVAIGRMRAGSDPTVAVSASVLCDAVEERA